MNKNKTKQTQLNHSAPEEMGKINRRTFCACMAGGVAAGAGLVSCGEAVTDNFTEATLSEIQVATLRGKGYLEISAGAIVVYNAANKYGDGWTYKAFTKTCPHKQGNVKANTSTEFQCQKHPVQFFNFNGTDAVTNKAETSDNLPKYKVTDNGDDTLLITRG